LEISQHLICPTFVSEAPQPALIEFLDCSAGGGLNVCLRPLATAAPSQGDERKQACERQFHDY
jgi:hypothetical protein